MCTGSITNYMGFFDVTHTVKRSFSRVQLVCITGVSNKPCIDVYKVCMHFRVKLCRIIKVLL